MSRWIFVLGTFVLAASTAARADGPVPPSPRPVTPASAKPQPSAAPASPTPAAGTPPLGMPTMLPSAFPLPAASAAPEAAVNDKLDGPLNALAAAYAKGGDKGFAAGAPKQGVALEKGKVRVEIVVTKKEAVADVRKAITAAGGTVEADLENRVFAALPGKAVGALAAREDVWTMAVQRATSAPVLK